MTAFARASRVLHRNSAMSVAATYSPASGRGLPQVEVRVIMSEAIEPLGMGQGAGALTQRREASLTADALGYDPAKGDELFVGELTYRVERPTLDIEASAWRLTLAERP